MPSITHRSGDPGRHREVRGAARALPRRRPRRGRLPGLPPEQRHLRPAPGRPQPDGAGEGRPTARSRPSSSTCSATSPTTYSRGWGHITTRQNVQFHFVAARAGPRRAARPRLGRPHHPRGLRRHRPQRAGLPPRRRLPVRGARHQPVGRGRLPALPAQPARPAPAPQVQDQLLRLRDRLRPGDVQRRRRDRRHPHAATTAPIEPGFRVFVAGGLGANPHPALALEEFTAREDLLPTIEAMPAGVRQHGNRDNKLRARMKWLVDTLGLRRAAAPRSSRSASSCSASSTWPGGIPADRRRSTATRPPASRPTVTPTPIGQGTPGHASRAHRAVRALGRGQRRARRRPRAPCRPYAYATLGDITSDQFRALAAIQRELGAEVRVTNRQNFVFRGLDRGPAAHAATQRLDAIGMAEPGAELARDVVACPGADTCNLAVTQSRGLADAIGAALEEAGLAEVGGVRINISGCTNSCGQHHIVRHRLLRRRAPGPRPVRARLPDAARRLRRPGADRLRREGAAPAGQERARGRRAGRRAGSPTSARPARRSAAGWTASGGAKARRPTASRTSTSSRRPRTAPEFYVDYDETGPYVAEIGDSECAT